MKTDTVKNYIVKAEHDLGTAEIIYETKPEFTDTITFHCQQTIEKCLKAFLTFHDVKIKSKHDIIFLFQQCYSIESEFQAFSMNIITDINDIGMSVRYEDIENDPKQAEALGYLECAREVMKLTLKKLTEKGFSY